MIPILPTAPPIVAPTEVAPLAKAESVKVVAKTEKTKRLTATPILAKPAQPVRVFTIALGSYKNPENVAALLQHAKQQGDAVQTIEKTKGLTTVVMRVQLRESELPTKLAQIGNAYNTKPVVLAH